MKTMRLLWNIGCFLVSSEIMKKTSALLLFAASISATQAVVLARWTPVSVATFPVEGADYNDGSDTPPASEVAANMMASSLDRIGGAEFGGGNPSASFPGRATDGAAGISLGDYTNFTLTPDPGFTASYTSITYNYNTFGASAPGGYSLFLRSDVDGFASDVATTSVADGVGSGLATFSISTLTGLSTPVEFRIYASAPTATGGNRWFDLGGDDVATDVGLIVNGEVTPVPEPTSGMLAVLAGLGLAARRRR